MPDDGWAIFTRRTNDPKLAWLEKKLTAAGIPSQRQGASFHAPCLYVPTDQLEAAWKILTPVDELPDNDWLFQP